VRFWPPLLWLLVYVASELILLGSHRRWAMLTAGLALAVLALASALWLALRRDSTHPLPGWFYLAIAGVAACYAVTAIAAGHLGLGWAIGALAAGTIPMTAVALLLASLRRKTVRTEAGARDASGDRDDPLPGIGLDEASPLGDTSEHSDAWGDPDRRRAARIRHG
jgi:hypothetical protein